jgi:hypothetical protein
VQLRVNDMVVATGSLSWSLSTAAAPVRLQVNQGAWHPGKPYVLNHWGFAVTSVISVAWCRRGVVRCALGRL